ncbi:hypothetical protein, conserved [Trypanosoma brucei brucei TREU927]|uniref:Uncharacterized protein n=1 Tax=Trypanosoma brucei brucei (strain 927/4 GUTat10.1) TaxID=185431 RepID=Q387S5_TRYB2|nr:hypothetical protein, conserved [Trypanosoma brucei brucei TREU927]EAN78947.1 hypothetical protein, conserved [Trypanosoma brucei brucei TREU927]
MRSSSAASSTRALTPGKLKQPGSTRGLKSTHSGSEEAVLSDKLLLFLQQSRERTSHNHAARISLLESQYTQSLHGLSGARGSSTLFTEASLNARKGGRHGRDPAGIVDKEIVIEVDMSESEDEVSSQPIETNHRAQQREHAATQFSSVRLTASSCRVTATAAATDLSPQSLSESYGVSPEVRTPISPFIEKMHYREVLCAPELPQGPEKRNKTTTHYTATELSLGRAQAGVRANVGRGMVSSLPPCAAARNEVSVSLERAINEARDKHNWSESTTANVMSRGTTTAPPMLPRTNAVTSKVDDEVQHSPLFPHEPEIEEFLAWEAAKPAELLKCLRAGFSNHCPIATAYAAVRPEVHWLSLLCNSESDVKSEAKGSPLRPDSAPSRFIEWIASDVDCYEGLLLQRGAVAPIVARSAKS